MPAQRAQAVADVAREVLDADGAELVPRPFAHLFDAAESDQRLPPRFVRRHAGAPVLLDLLLDMEADLVIEPVLEFLPADSPGLRRDAATYARAHPSDPLKNSNPQLPIPNSQENVGSWRLEVGS